MKNYLLILLLSLSALISGCGDSGAKTEGKAGSQNEYDVHAVMYVDETREIELNLDATKSYEITAATKREVKKVSHSLDYYNKVRPMLSVKALSVGEETIVVTSKTPEGDSSQLTVNVLVVANDNGSNGDSIGGDPLDTSEPTDPTDPTDPGNPPPAPGESKAIFDRNACAPTIDFGRVTDDWIDVEGQFGEDGGGYIRSAISNAEHNSEVELYYPKQNSYSSPMRYYSFIRFNYTTPEGIKIIYNVELSTDIIGQAEYFYVKSNGYCLRMNIPSSVISIPDTSVTWVSGIY